MCGRRATTGRTANAGSTAPATTSLPPPQTNCSSSAGAPLGAMTRSQSEPAEPSSLSLTANGMCSSLRRRKKPR